jgi:hypothetical protein
MNTTISDFISVRDKLLALGYRAPTGLAILPLNLEHAASPNEIRLQSEAATVKTLFRQAGIPLDELFEPSNRPLYVQNNDVHWVAPAIFVAAGVLSENPNAVSVALGVLSNYLTDFFKGRTSEPQIKATIVVETTKTKTCKRIEYEGNVEGLKALADVVKGTQDDTEPS